MVVEELPTIAGPGLLLSFLDRHPGVSPWAEPLQGWILLEKGGKRVRIAVSGDSPVASFSVLAAYWKLYSMHPDVQVVEAVAVEQQ